MGSIEDSTDVIRNGQSAATPMLEGTRSALKELLGVTEKHLPSECRELVLDVAFQTINTGTPYFPCPFKQTEAIGALKAVEAGLEALIADLRYGKKQRSKKVDLERASCFMFSTYLITIAGMNKQHPNVKSKLIDTDLLKAQSILYRRLSANLYQTANPGEYYHIHGSLEATKTLNMIGLEGHRPDMTDYRESIDLIESHVKKYTAAELEKLNADSNQAGVQCLKPEQWNATPHGQRLNQEPPWRVDALEIETPPVPFNKPSSSSPRPQIIDGVKVLELCRIIAGPSIARGLAEHGASVLKVTSPNLSDVPFFQVDGNLGKHAISLDLKKPEHRARFEELLADADVLVDGYRPGALARLGYGPRQLKDLGSKRGKGFVYVAENCFGHVGEWATRPGWQQIADCATGVAWEQGRFMGLNEPVVPPFPMSDYGTGCMGTIAALVGLYNRATKGGSWHATASLCQYDIFLLRLGLYDQKMQETLRNQHDPAFFELRHADSVDEVGKRALVTMKKVHPELFEDKHFHEARCRGYGGEIIRFVKPVCQVEGVWNGFVRGSRTNGFDDNATSKTGLGWNDWETDAQMVRME